MGMVKPDVRTQGMKNYRIIWDSAQWIVQKYRPAALLKKGPHKGKLSKAGWAHVGYHTRLKYAVESMVDKEIKARLEQEGLTQIEHEELEGVVVRMEEVFQEAREEVGELLEGMRSDSGGARVR